MEYIPASNCTTPDNKHVFETAEAPYYVQCEVCGQRFMLVSERVFEKINALAVERPREKQ